MSFRDALGATAIGLVMSIPFIVEIVKSIAR